MNTLGLVEKSKGIQLLVAEIRNESQRMVGKAAFFSLLSCGKGLMMMGVDNVDVGMNIRWDHFVNHYDTARYMSGADGKDNRHVQFVREFASVISVLQVGSCVVYLRFSDERGRYNIINL